MDSKSPKGYSHSKCAKWLVNGGYLPLTKWDDPPSMFTSTDFFSWNQTSGTSLITDDTVCKELSLAYPTGLENMLYGLCTSKTFFGKPSKLSTSFLLRTFLAIAITQRNHKNITEWSMFNSLVFFDYCIVGFFF